MKAFFVAGLLVTVAMGPALAGNHVNHSFNGADINSNNTTTNFKFVTTTTTINKTTTIKSASTGGVFVSASKGGSAQVEVIDAINQ